MEASLQHSTEKVRKSTTRTERPITPEEAAQLLASALSYCQKAGLVVKGYNDGVTLVLELEGLNELAGRIVVVKPSDGVTAEPMVSPSEDKVTPSASEAVTE